VEGPHSSAYQQLRNDPISKAELGIKRLAKDFAADSPAERMKSKSPFG
jgi:hypothetical protein